MHFDSRILHAYVEVIHSGHDTHKSVYPYKVARRGRMVYLRNRPMRVLRKLGDRELMVPRAQLDPTSICKVTLLGAQIYERT